MESRHGLVVNAMVTQATGTAERDAAVALVGARPSIRRITLGGDKNYDTAAFVDAIAGPTGDPACRPTYDATDECH